MLRIASLPRPQRAAFVAHTVLVAVALSLACELESQPVGELPMESSEASSATSASETSSDDGHEGGSMTTAPATESTSAATSSEGSDGSGSSTDALPTCAEMPEIIDDACDLFAQDCPDCYRCTWQRDDATGEPDTGAPPVCRLAPEDGGVALGEACTADIAGSNDDCAPGSFCWPPASSGFAPRCTAFCSGDGPEATCDAPDTLCLGLASACVPTCDPIDGACDDGGNCQDIGGGYACYPQTPGTVGALGTCGSIFDCAPGLECASADLLGDAACDGSSCCVPRCDLEEGGDEACAAIDAALSCRNDCGAPYQPPGFEHIGVCQTGC